VAWAAWVVWASKLSQLLLFYVWGPRVELAAPLPLRRLLVHSFISFMKDEYEMFPDIERVTAVIREVAEEEALPRFRALKDGDVREKRAGDLVTVADLAVEARLAERLPELLPGSLVVGEEAVEEDATVLDRVTGNDFVWIIDPIDGTTNFAHGRPAFAVMVALTRGHEILAGWIHDPLGKRTAVAGRGEGTYLNGEKVRISAERDVKTLRGTLHFGNYAHPEIGRLLERNRSRVNTHRSLRCAGQEYLRLMRGESDFALFTKTKPWDHCAGVLLHQEAGGAARLLTGKSYGPRDHAAPGLLMAPSEEAWRALHGRLLGGESVV